MYPTKSNPAPPCITACSVRAAEAPRVNTIYQHPESRYRESEADRQTTSTAQTIRSDDGTTQIIWEDSPPSSSGSTVSLVRVQTVDDEDEQTSERENVNEYKEGKDEVTSRSSSPLAEKLKTRLRAWSWEKEQGHEEKPRWLPLMEVSRQRERSSDLLSDSPVAPPNTEMPSKRSSIANKQSASQSPELREEGSDEDEEIQPIELRVKSILARPQSARDVLASDDYLTVPIARRNSLPVAPTVQRNLSNLDDTHFKQHRDSCEVTRNRFHQHEAEGRMMNQHLMNSQDSFLLNKTRMGAVGGWNRFKGLSPIPDASPPNFAGGMSSIADASPPQRSKLRVEITEACTCACPVHCPGYRTEGRR